MFFIFGISSGKKRLDFNQTMVCPNCGHFGRLEVYMTYMYFSLFFIPLFKWGKRYLVKTSCCNGVCDIPNELGKRIEKGQTVEIDSKDTEYSNNVPTVDLVLAKSLNIVPNVVNRYRS